MIEKWRPHTMRELESIPGSMAWRLHSIERTAGRALALAQTSNEVLARAGEKTRIPVDTFESLQRVAGTFRERSAAGAA